MSDQGVIQSDDLLAGRYRLIKMIGSGGMGKVFLASDEHLNGKLWAVKQCEFGKSELSLKEAELLMKLNHPHLPRIVDYIEDQASGAHYIVMDYIEGRTVRDLLEKAPHLINETLIVKWGIQICSIFDYLHNLEEPIIYRDLKPSNVMINEKGNLTLIDFGISRKYKQGVQQDTMQLGTHGFAAPEQYEGGQSDPRTDLYLLGAFLYYLLSGGRYAKPIQQDTTYSLNSFPLNLPEDTASSWRKYLHTLLQLKPEHRYANANQALAELKCIQRKMEQRNTSGHPKSNGQEVRKIAVLGISSGVGASFVAQALAMVLSDQLRNKVHIYELDEHAEDRVCKKISKLTFIKQMKLLDIIQQLQLDEKIVIDLSAHLDSLSRVEKEVDLFLFVADALPHRFNSKRSESAFQLAQQLMAKDIKVAFIGNRRPGKPFEQQWLQSFPARPVVLLPEISYPNWVEAEWNGKHILHDKDRFEQVKNAFKPLLSTYLKKEKRSEKSWISNFFREKRLKFVKY